MSILSAILQGILQGLTEFLPVSSSGHLSLYQYFTGINSESSVTFSVMLHLGTLLAVIIAFWSTVWQLLKEFLPPHAVSSDPFLRAAFAGAAAAGAYHLGQRR